MKLRNGACDLCGCNDVPVRGYSCDDPIKGGLDLDVCYFCDANRDEREE